MLLRVTGWCMYSVVHLWCTLYMIHYVAVKWLPFTLFEEHSSSHIELNILSLSNSERLQYASVIHFGLAGVTWFGLTFLITVPFGRHAVSSGIRWRLPASLSWCLQELPTLMNVGYSLLYEIPYIFVDSAPKSMASRPEQGSFCIQLMSQIIHTMNFGKLEVEASREGDRPPLNGCLQNLAVSAMHVNCVALSLFFVHYLHRSLIYPLWLGFWSPASPVPIHVTWSATLYCVLNGRLQVLAALSIAEWVSDEVPPFQSVWTAVVGTIKSVIYNHTDETTTRIASSVINIHEGWQIQLALTGLMVIGVGLWICGAGINMTSDYHLLWLRRSALIAGVKAEGGDTPQSSTTLKGSSMVNHSPLRKGKYIVPFGNWFNLVSCPNFFGEIVEWTGYAMTMWFSTALILLVQDTSLSEVPKSADRALYDALTHPTSIAAFSAASSFAVYTAANLLPRARAHHQWYHDTFKEDYAKLNRSAVIPGIY